MKDLIETLKGEFTDKDYAHSYMEGHNDTRIAAQVHSLRKQRGLSEDELAKQSGLTKECILDIESDNFDELSINTLQKIARVFDVNLRVEFESFSDGLFDVMQFNNLEIKSRDMIDEPLTPFYQWVNDNNPSEDLSYRKGWWDFVEYIYKLSNLLKPKKVSTIATYMLNTPPPCENIEMPIVLMEFDTASFVLKLDFSRILGNEWEVCVIRQSNVKIENIEPFFTHNSEVNIRDKFKGIPSEYVSGDYNASQGQFSCCVSDEMDVYAIIKLVLNDA